MARRLPREELPPLGRDGAAYGWPAGIMTVPIVEALRSEGFTKTSQVCVLVHSISRERFRVFLEGQEDRNSSMGNTRGLYEQVHEWVTGPPPNPERIEFRSRIPAEDVADAIDHTCQWTGADYTFMIGLLTTVRTPITDQAQSYIDNFRSVYPVWRAMHMVGGSSRALR